MSGSHRNAGNKKIRIFPKTIDEDVVQNIWEMLKKALNEILKKKHSGLSFEELYRNSYNMVLNKKGEVLYEGLSNVLIKHLEEDVCKQVEESIGRNRFLDTLNSVWQDHETAMTMIRDILMYMDRVYVEQEKKEKVYNLGLRLFRNKVIDQHTINNHLKATLLSMIASERRKEAIQWLSLKNLIQMLSALGLDNRTYYEEQFENLFLQESAEFYRNAAQNFLQQNSASAYIRKVNECLQDEAQRAEKYLDKITGDKIVEVLKSELIESYMRAVIGMQNSGMVFMLTNEKFGELKAMYELYSKVQNGVAVMTEFLSTYLRSRGQALVQENEQTSGVQFIQQMIDLKDLFDRFLSESFKSDKEIKQKMQTDFVYFFNLSQKSPEYLSMYIDDKLKKGLRSVNENDAEQVLDKSMILFKFLQEKDVFERYYKQHLCRRLLFGKSVSDDSEKSMIAKLRTECGCQFTSKLEGMFKDMALSETITSEYHAHLAANPGADQSRIDLSVNVLTKVHWPTTQSEPCNLPLSATQAFAAFSDFYVSKHNGRRIYLNPALGSADVKAIFYGSASGRGDEPGSSNAVARREEHKILQCHTHHMIILMKFNERQKYTLKDLREATKIADKDFKRALMSLALGKVTQRILIRTKSNGKDLADDDEFIVNDGYTSKLTRIKIQMVSGRGETEPERKETRDKVNDDRKHEIEAAIVRIMKARKRSLHNDLITEVTNQLKIRFMPDPSVIKKRIESLIEREYLKRDDNDHRLYHYVA
ncbi:unnamed protein product [Bursaphelenchus okinawaensis]|uniref:Cullin family profile domain-containing protein n=1 Tax=Bursaphelenchus okinawaensis TaxID=465554 RepID=A0A811LTB2_9BILA|nr:unnamed protein product [Bursaphelenchus okinawaensis]CAG9128196.1 unnamed protein product [Bursaphelenchus okinawaensis]